MQTKCAPTLSYNEDTHEYRVGERIFPSVTQVLVEAGIVDTRWYSEYAATKGTYVAQATSWHDKNELDVEALDPVLLPYLEAWKLFLKDSAFASTEIEKPRFNSIFCFAGTPDRIGTMREMPTIIDIKTGAKEKWHRLQLSGYELLATAVIHQRIGVYLSGDGTYSLETYSDTSDRQVFLAALAVVNWKRRNR